MFSRSAKILGCTVSKDQLLEHAIKESKGDPSHDAQVFAAFGFYDRALNILEFAELSDNPDEAFCDHCLRGKLNLLKNSPEEAQFHFSLALEILERSPGSYSQQTRFVVGKNLSAAYAEQGQFFQALHVIDTTILGQSDLDSLPVDLLILTLNKSAEYALYACRDISPGEGREEISSDALSKVERAIEIASEEEHFNPIGALQGLIIRGNLERLIGNTAKAFETFEEALLLKPLLQQEDFGELLRVQLLRACLLLETGNSTEANKLFHELGVQVERAEAQVEYAATLGSLQIDTDQFTVPREVATAVHAFRLFEAYRDNDRARIHLELDKIRNSRSEEVANYTLTEIPSATSPEGFLRYLSDMLFNSSRILGISSEDARKSAQLAKILKK